MSPPLHMFPIMGRLCSMFIRKNAAIIFLEILTVKNVQNIGTEVQDNRNFLEILH